jgi:uncharacterized membrane protein YeaQ/YmgE (transglycosylase-associated protein family)
MARCLAGSNPLRSTRATGILPTALSRITIEEEIIMQYIWFALIGIVAGFIAGKIMEGRGFGILGNLVVGVVGAVLGGGLFGLLGLTATGLVGSLVVATVGAVVLLAIVGAVFKQK